jgi:hypothetical protein
LSRAHSSRSRDIFDALAEVPSRRDPIPRAKSSVVTVRSPFIEIEGPSGMRSWSDGTTIIYVRAGKLAGTVAVSGSLISPTMPPAGTPLYRANGTFAGWIGPDSARPPNTHSVLVSSGFSPVVGENFFRFGDTSDATGRPKTIYINGYTRRDGTYVQSHWRSLPNRPNESFFTSNYSGTGVAENGSYYGEISRYNGLPKTTYVRGYTRRDGTTVRSHYRSH